MPRNDPDVSDGRPDDREHLGPAVNVQALRGGAPPASNKSSPLNFRAFTRTPWPMAYGAPCG
eukprot:381935-Prymnesium_polylepis.1